MRRHLLALNVGSATLKGATYGLETTKPADHHA